MKKTTFLSVFGLFLFSVAAYAAIPEPHSEGKYFSGKGTRSSEQYENTAGMPIYEYGKGIQWGPVHFKPSASYRYRWTDNVFYEEDNEKSDFIHSFDAEALAELPLAGGQHILSGAYAIQRELFNRFDSQNHTDQSGRVGLKLNFVPFTLDLEDIYEQTVSRADTEFTGRVKRDENAFHSLLEIPFASFFLENEITDFDISYSRAADQAFDHNRFTIYQRVGYDMTPATQVLVEYAYGFIDYSNTTGDVNTRNGDLHQYMLGLRGNFTERIAYQVWGGVQHRIYDQDIQPDFNGFVLRSALQWEISEINSLSFRADRAPQESTFDNQNFYTRNRLELSWRRQIAERWAWKSHGAVSYNEYSRITVFPLTGVQKTRRDTPWDIGTGLEYKMPNDIISIVLDYRFAARDSNVSDLGYGAHEISAGVRASF